MYSLLPRWLIFLSLFVASLQWGLHRFEHGNPAAYPDCPLCQLSQKTDQPPPTVPDGIYQTIVVLIPSCIGAPSRILPLEVPRANETRGPPVRLTA